jgi:hypothetical protein
MTSKWFSTHERILLKTKSQFYVLPLRSLRGGRPTRLDTILSNRVASRSLDASSGDHRTGAKYNRIDQTPAIARRFARRRLSCKIGALVLLQFLEFGVDALGCDLVTPGTVAVVPSVPTVPLYCKGPAVQLPRFGEGLPAKYSEFHNMDHCFQISNIKFF